MRRRRAVPIGLNVASMIDVVFLLLMYFMVATDFSPSEETFRMDLPERHIGSDSFSLKDRPLQVEVLAAGSRSQPIFTIPRWGSPTGSIDSLRTQLEGLRGVGQHGGSAARFTADHPVEILVSPAAGWGWAVEAFNAAVAAGFTSVRLDARTAS